MINGIIKLFYSEIVKSKIKKLPEAKYEIREEFQGIKNITTKLDNIFLNALKFIVGILILLIGFNIKFIIGLEVLLVEILYVFYKKNLAYKVKDNIDTIKNNIQSTGNLFDQTEKNCINLMISLILMNILIGDSIPILISFIVVFLFTIKHICSNIK
ncbi:MAG: hypothetical protein IJH34_06925 [Romboutsia sp.]|nr:hypothetical protein [Romboutsia sp.]